MRYEEGTENACPVSALKVLAVVISIIAGNRKCHR